MFERGLSKLYIFHRYQLACRGVFQNMGQNCAGPERFLVYSAVYEKFCSGVAEIVAQMRQGAPLHSDLVCHVPTMLISCTMTACPGVPCDLSLGFVFGPQVDCGALCMPQHRQHLQRLVDDAVAKGAKVLAGGKSPAVSSSALSTGQFYPPTVLADVTEDMVIMQEEIFGPIMCITRLPNGTAGDEEAVRCPPTQHHISQSQDTAIRSNKLQLCSYCIRLV